MNTKRHSCNFINSFWRWFNLRTRPVCELCFWLPSHSNRFISASVYQICTRAFYIKYVNIWISTSHVFVIKTGNTMKKHLPVIIRFEGAVLVEAHVLGLLVRELCQVSIKVWQVQTGHILIWRKHIDQKLHLLEGYLDSVRNKPLR